MFIHYFCDNSKREWLLQSATVIKINYFVTTLSENGNCKVLHGIKTIYFVTTLSENGHCKGLLSVLEISGRLVVPDDQKVYQATTFW